MWRFWHRLFGWHYAYLERHYSALGTKHSWIRRVRMTKAGERYVAKHDDDLVFLDRLEDGYTVTPLTWIEPIHTPPNLKVVNQ
jgi:hypothetical protein